MDLCEDYVLHRSCVDRDGLAVQILLLADGMGSCPLAREGARGVCDRFSTELAAYLSTHSLDDVSRAVCQEATLAFFADLEQPRDYGTTLLAAIVSHERTHLFQCGDGDIFYATPETPQAFEVFIVPEVQAGVYSNATFPADIAVQRERDVFGTIETPQRLALMSDGVSPFFVDGHGVVHHQASDRLFSHFEALELTEDQANEKLANTLDQEHFKSVHDDRSALLFYR